MVNGESYFKNKHDVDPLVSESDTLMCGNVESISYSAVVPPDSFSALCETRNFTRNQMEYHNK